MASNYTPNYNLCQWKESDKVLRTEFNADNAKIDAALAGKVSAAALDSLKTEINSKIGALQGAVSGQGTALELRNCQCVSGSYTGAGKVGADNPNIISFSNKPVFLCVSSAQDVRAFFAVRGQKSVWYQLSGSQYKLAFTWGSRSVSWYSGESGSRASAENQLNAGTPYNYFAILDLDG